ncbi:MAG TPA: class II aldolase/adducin family protein, partial [Acidimicrobiales bacterium]|nr:class II aldolase/adducin family protein [Acidimicrobiales bacterium]
MKSRWIDDEAAAEADEVGLCAYASRLLGADPSLVLAGGGNSSVKVVAPDVFGDPVDVLHVKGSGWDMASLRPQGMAPLRLATVARLAELDTLTDARMAAELRAASLDPGAPAPSVESILHAILPFRYVLHTHADAVLALTDTPLGDDLVDEVFGADVVLVPYVMPGFALAKLCAEVFPAARTDETVGMVLANHGLFTFADDARTAYENHVTLVARALARIEAGSPTGGGAPDGSSTDAVDDDAVAVDIGAFGAGDPDAFGTGDRSAIAPGSAAAELGVDGEPIDDPATLATVAALRLDLSRVAGHPMV